MATELKRPRAGSRFRAPDSEMVYVIGAKEDDAGDLVNALPADADGEADSNAGLIFLQRADLQKMKRVKKRG